jgi:uncharacterized membrane protein
VIIVTLALKDNSEACAQALSDLETLQKDYPHQLVMLNHSQDPDLVKYDPESLPVLEVGPYRLRNPFSRQDIQVALGAAQDRQDHLIQVGDITVQKRQDRGHRVSKADRFSYWFTRHYMLVFNTFVFLFIGLPFLAPVLLKADIQPPARVIYTFYSMMCHQLAFRSWFLFGEQPAYPRAMAGVPGYQSLAQVAGIADNDLTKARAFTGNPAVGYKVAFCERDVAIYGSILLFGVIFSVYRSRIKSLPWYIWLLIGIVPMGIDGVSQIPSLLTIALPAWIPLRESTPFLRTLTGFLFGFSTAWYGYPFIYEAMEETKRLMKYKMAVVEQTT